MHDIPTNLFLSELINEKKLSRRWQNIRFAIRTSIVLTIFLMLIGSGSELFADDTINFDAAKPYFAVVPLEGEVSSGALFSADRAIPLIQKAFEDKKARAIILKIDSPGGSPVQASQIYNELRRQKQKHPSTKVIAVGGEMMTSAAYLVAAGADEIYVNKNTVAGSIGVIMTGFGFDKAIEKLGVERRVFTAGEHKSQLDSFKPLTAQNERKIQHVLKDAHTNFIDDIVATRADRLHADPSILFSGDFWTGTEAVKLGLADGIADLGDLMQRYKIEQVKMISAPLSFQEKIFSGVYELASVKLQSSQHRLHAGF